jgi:hypothetical protein
MHDALFKKTDTLMQFQQSTQWEDAYVGCNTENNKLTLEQKHVYQHNRIQNYISVG